MPCAHLQRPIAVDQVVDAACEKSVVLLGELPSHGGARAFEAKASIARRLVEGCQFSAVLFEAPIYEFELIRSPPGKTDVNQEDTDRAIGPFWSSKELESWRTWLHEAEVSGKVRIGGLDDQSSDKSLLTERALPELVVQSMSEPEASHCVTAVQRYLQWDYSEESPFDEIAKRKLAKCSRSASSQISQTVSTARDAMVTAFDRHASRLAGDSAAADRDESMLQNLKWHLSAMPAGAKVVVWTATVHAAREPGGRPYTPLGNRLSQILGDRLLAVGFTTAGGTTARFGSDPRPLEQMPVDSLEAIALGSSLDSVYLDHTSLKLLDGKLSRLYGKPSSHTWSQHFDGVVIFRDEKPPTFPTGKNLPR